MNRWSFLSLALTACSGCSDGLEPAIEEHASSIRTWDVVVSYEASDAAFEQVTLSAQRWEHALASVCPSRVRVVRGEVLADDTRIPSDGTIRVSEGIPRDGFDATTDWKDTPLHGSRMILRTGYAAAYEDYWQASAHELGHAFGLEHAPAAGSVMYRYWYAKVSDVSPRDARMYAERWCK